MKKNRQLQITRNKENKQKKKKWFVEYKKTLKCNRCPEDHPAALDFHHRDATQKEGEVCRLLMHNRSLENIKAEIEKCEVLCANCHRKLHYNMSLV
jgi:protein-arginine kinase activator protein McsA